MDTLVSPSRTIAIGEKKFLLDGSFATLRAVQEAFKRDLVYVLASIYGLRLDEIASLIAIASGKPDDINAIGQQITDGMDILDFSKSSAYSLLKTELSAWLIIAIAPKADREKKSQEMQGLIERQKLLPSRGQTTSASPSAPSDGSQASSGEATSGN